MAIEEATVSLHDLEPSTDSNRDEVIAGLRQSPKRLPCKLFYDERGSELFEEICQLDEYYLTRTELSIMDDHAAAMAARIGSSAVLIELGSGASVKTRILLDHLRSPAAYVPVDISRDHLQQTAAALKDDYPELHVAPVCADFTSRVELPDVLAVSSPRVVYFPGSTIGNFPPREAIALLRNIRQLSSVDGGLLIGFDRQKEVAVLEAAYNDVHGVTAQFNLNILRRINRELDADFDEDAFEHRAFYNRELGRMEIYLVSRREQQVRVGDEEFKFAAGEAICTEYSYKFSLDGFQRLAEEAGFRVDQCWSDQNEMFSVVYLAAK